MNENRSFWRKVYYVIAIVALFIPMSMLSMPATLVEKKASGSDALAAQDEEGDKGEATLEGGGMLAKLRQDYKLGQASLGKIDPASETMKLATLGMRGLAVTVLWQQATYYKKTENWTKFQASLYQIARLQPNFISVWQYQAWNTSYNLSVEFDDYHDRYRWVIRGIDYLKDGLEYNRNEPRLNWDLGWFIAQKIGRADEHIQYRRLFKRDDVFHAGSGRTYEQRDNWLVGKYWFQVCIDSVDKHSMRMKGKPPLIYRSDPGMSQINYSNAIQAEGVHGRPARDAWTLAGKDWKKYGDESILTSWDFRIQLNDLDRRKAEAEDYMQQLNTLSQGLMEQIRNERLAEMTPEERVLAQLPFQEVPEEQREEFHELQARLNITPVHVADRIEKDNPELAIEASRLGKQWFDANRRADAIERYRETINFNYWKDRCAFEQSPGTLEARELIYKAHLAHEKQDLILARKLYEQAWPLWRKSFDEYPLVANEGIIAEELIESIADYRMLLEDLSVEQFPQDFVLRDIVESFDRDKLVIDVFVEPADSKPGDSATQADEKKAAGEKLPDASVPEASPEAEKTSPPMEGAPPEPSGEEAGPTPTKEPAAEQQESPVGEKASSEKPAPASTDTEDEGAPPEPKNVGSSAE